MDTTRRELLVKGLQCTPAIISVTSLSMIEAVSAKPVEIPSTQLVGQNLTLGAQLREMDRLIFTMSQCSDFDGMRIYFNALQELSRTRQLTESNRINSAIEISLLRMYGR